MKAPLRKATTCEYQIGFINSKHPNCVLLRISMPGETVSSKPRMQVAAFFRTDLECTLLLKRDEQNSESAELHKKEAIPWVYRG